MGAATARTLTWTAAFLAVVGAMVGSPPAGVLVLCLGVLLGALAAIPGPRRARVLAALVTLACLTLAVLRFGEARREMARYREAATHRTR